MEEKKHKKRIIIDVSDQVHREVKTRASFRGITIKRWVELAIAERIKEEQKHE